ncbi:hypothetical protein ABZP36_004414 [Zizania latifolia]
MACSDLAVLLAAVVCVLCATPAALAQTVKIYWDCSPNNYSAGSAYDTSLRGMLKNVVAAAVSGGGYANDVAAGKAAYGLAICYTDALPGVCSLCLGMAAGNLSLACPLAASAAMMYNNCLLRYADAPFLALPDMTKEFSFYNPNMTSAGDAVQFSAALNRLMDRLAPAASAGAATAASSTRGGQRFAFGQTNITSDDSLYGFVQCVDDLSSDDCRRCLQSLAATLPMTRGGRAYTLTCYTRFEVNPIYIPPHVGNLVVAAAPPAELPVAKVSVADGNELQAGGKHRTDTRKLRLTSSQEIQTASVVDSDHHSTYFPDWIYRCLSDLGSLQSFDMDHETEQIARKMASIGLWCIQVSPSSRPTMSRVLEMFERSADQLEIPPKHCFFTAIQEGSSEQELGQSS